MRVLLGAFAILVVACAARAQTAALPEPVRGLWIAGECASPRSVLFMTAGSWAVLPKEGQQKLWRLGALSEAGGFTVAVADDEERTRTLIRVTPVGLETRAPPAKLADAALPGDGPSLGWRRCEGLPMAEAALHGEGLALLSALDTIGGACAAGAARACLDAVWAFADVTADGTLSPAELARLTRAVTYVAMLSDGAEVTELAGAVGAGALGGIAAGYLLVQSLDFDGSGTISRAELAQDRVPVVGAAGLRGGAAASVPGLAGQLGGLRALVEQLGPLLGLPGR